MDHFYFVLGLNFKNLLNFLRELPQASSYALRK